MKNIDGQMRWEKMLEEASKKGASDIHIAPDVPVLFRVHGKLIKMAEEMITLPEISQMLGSIMSNAQKRELQENGETDFAYSFAGKRMRIHVFRQNGSYAASIRLLSLKIPDVKEFGIPQAALSLTEEKSGLLLVTGGAGSGKTTTLASLTQQIALREECAIITLERPIEYLYENGGSIVLQREVGIDTHSYASGMTAALREDPDVIFVGELSDEETILAAIAAAQTGHLVLAALHTNSVISALEYLTGMFLPHKKQQISMQLAEVLLGIFSQQLLPRQDENGRVPAFEIMIAQPTIKTLIKEQKYHQILSVMHSAAKQGMISMDDSIYQLYIRNLISAKTAIAYAEDAQDMSRKVQLF